MPGKFIISNQIRASTFLEYKKYEFEKFSFYLEDDVHEFKSIVDTNRSIFSFGFFTNINDVSKGELDILKSLNETETLNEFIDIYNSLSGSFLFVFVRNDSCFVISDIFCQKRVFYNFSGADFCLSNSEFLMSQFLNTENEISQEKKQLFKNEIFKDQQECWICEDKEWDSRFTSLLPNHILHISEQKPIRIAIPPNLKLSRKELKLLLKKSIANALLNFSRFNIHLSLSGGRDSRLLLACNTNNKKNAKNIVFKRHGRHNLLDVLFARLVTFISNQKLRIINFQLLNPVFKSFLESQQLNARILLKTSNLQWFHNSFTKNDINVTGDGGDLLRQRGGFRNFQKNIVEEYDYSELNSVRNFLDNWNQEINSYLQNTDIKVSDLFYLELRIGKWAAIGSHEMEIIGCKEFTPFANRALIFSFLEAKNKYDINKIFNELVNSYIPASFLIPYNPPKFFKFIKSLIK